MRLILSTRHPAQEVKALLPYFPTRLVFRVSDPKDSKVLTKSESAFWELNGKVGPDSLPFLAVLAKLVRKGVNVRLLHAKEPGLRQEELLRRPYCEMKSLLCNLGLSSKVLRLNNIFQ